MNTRQAEILEIIRIQGQVTVLNLADHFEVSPMTIRRDMLLLEQEGELTRTHGGAVLSQMGVVEFAFKEKAKTCSNEKKAIAEKIAPMLEPGMKILLDTGTTTLEVAKAISGMRGLTVLTPSLAIASVLYANEDMELVILGGTARKGNPDLTGWLTEENIKEFRVDLAIVGADGVNQEGLYTSDGNIARVVQLMLSCAQHSICAIDHTKFERTSFVKCASWKDIDHLVTDSGVPQSTRRWLKKKVKTITYAGRIK